jgi:hypothetical protein
MSIARRAPRRAPTAPFGERTEERDAQRRRDLHVRRHLLRPIHLFGRHHRREERTMCAGCPGHSP